MNVAGTFLSPWAFITETVHFIEHLLSARPFNASFHLTYTILFAFLQVMVSRLGEVIKLFKKMQLHIWRLHVVRQKGRKWASPAPVFPLSALHRAISLCHILIHQVPNRQKLVSQPDEWLFARLLYTGWFGLQLSASGWDERAR